MDGFAWAPSVAVQLAVAAVLWWRVGRAELEVTRLRDSALGANNAVARVEGAVREIHDILVDVLKQAR